MGLGSCGVVGTGALGASCLDFCNLPWTSANTLGRLQIENTIMPIRTATMFVLIESFETAGQKSRVKMK